MKLYLLRHGEAENRASEDAARRLTGRGQAEISSIGRQFRDRAPRLARCIASPYVRAQETARLFLAELGGERPAESSNLLIPEARPAELMHFLDIQPDESLLLISHNPLMSELNALLTAGNTLDLMVLGTGELVGIDIDIVEPGMGSSFLHILPDIRYAGAH